METIKNSELRVTVSPLGAEVQTLTDVRTGREYQWQGDARYWEGRSPVLFPIVGGMWNGVCRIDGREYRIPKHGFACHRTWQVAGNDGMSVTFTLEDTPEENAIFPYRYHIEVRYSLEGRTLRADYAVRSREQNATMYFQIGGHPGISLPDFSEDRPVSGYLRFDKRPHSMLRASEQGCTEPDRVPVPWSTDAAHPDLVPIQVETFANEALIFDGHQIGALEVLRPNGERVARVESSAPVWLVWSPQGRHAPFVCAEPWYGVCDSQHFDGPIEQRPFIQSVRPGETWTGWYTVEV